MHDKPVPLYDDAIRSTRRSALELAAQTSSTSYKTALPPTILRGALCTGVMPSGFEPHVGALLDEAPMSLLIKLVEQIHAEDARPREQVWSSMRDLAKQLKLTRDLHGADCK